MEKVNGELPMIDEYGCVRNLKYFKLELQEMLDRHGTCTFPYSGDEIGCLIICISKMVKVGIFPFSGGMGSTHVVSCIGNGKAHHFNCAQVLHCGYVKEKMMLAESDAISVTKILNDCLPKY